MKRLGRAITAGLILLPLLALTGCSGLDYMIEEYNSRFGIHDDRKMSLGEENFVASDMLEPQYIVRGDGSFGIPAPVGAGAIYEWQLLDYQTGTERLVKGANTRVFEARVADLSLTPGTVYVLKLKVTFKGKVYEDKADIFVKVIV